MEQNKNFFLAIALSVLVLIGWQAFYAGPKLEQEQARQRAAQQQQPQTPQQQTAAATQQNLPQPGQAQPAAPAPSAAASPGASGIIPAPNASREAALAQGPRVPVDTPSLTGSISLKGGRLDDLVLKKFNITPDPSSPNVVLFSPVGSPQPYFAQFYWVPAAGTEVSVPNDESMWRQESKGALSPGNPVILAFDNGAGLTFRRTIAVDENYLFTVTEEVENRSGAAVTLHPYGRIVRLYLPETAGFFVLHEGPIGVLGEKGLTELGYDDIQENSASAWTDVSKGWLGFTDKYWAAALVPDQTSQFQVNMYGTPQNHYFASYLDQPVTVAPGQEHEVTSRLFAGAKEIDLIDKYAEQFSIPNFDLLIDWGWFYFITKPMFFLLDFFYNLVGNFGVSILVVTVLIKLVFFPLANKSYESMSKLKKLQPDLVRIRDRFKDDRMRQQQEMMSLYKKEKVNPAAGCLPILIQIPVFFALYKVLFVTIEMRHAPFVGWIQDLSAPDPTSLFTLFGLIPIALPDILQVGIWPLLMGMTMFVQMKLNPAPTDPIQQKIFTYMPILFTFMLAQFPAGLVIYWTWNNLLSIIQQWVIMERQGVKVDLFENMGFKKKDENGRSRTPAE